MIDLGNRNRNLILDFRRKSGLHSLVSAAKKVCFRYSLVKRIKNLKFCQNRFKNVFLSVVFRFGRHLGTLLNLLYFIYSTLLVQC